MTTFFVSSVGSSSFLFLFVEWFLIEGGRLNEKVFMRIALCMSRKLTRESSTPLRYSLDMQSSNQQLTRLSMATSTLAMNDWSVIAWASYEVRSEVISCCQDLRPMVQSDSFPKKISLMHAVLCMLCNILSIVSGITVA